MAQRKRTKKQSAGRKPKSSRRKPQKRRTNVPAGPLPPGALALLRLRDWLLPSAEIFAGLGLHGNTGWTFSALVWMALVWAWSEAKNVTDAFDQASDQCRRLGLEGPGTYQGLISALLTWTDRLLIVMWRVLHQRMREIGGAFWQIGGWVPIARGRLPQHGPADEIERADVLRRKLRPGEDGQVPQEEDQRPQAAQK